MLQGQVEMPDRFHVHAIDEYTAPLPSRDLETALASAPRRRDSRAAHTGERPRALWSA